MTYETFDCGCYIGSDDLGENEMLSNIFDDGKYTKHIEDDYVNNGYTTALGFVQGIPVAIKYTTNDTFFYVSPVIDNWIAYRYGRIPSHVKYTLEEMGLKVQIKEDGNVGERNLEWLVDLKIKREIK